MMKTRTNTLEAFLQLFSNAEAPSLVIGTYHFLQELYSGKSESIRHYHNWQHLSECLIEMDEARLHFHDIDFTRIEIALWFHDAIYDSTSAQNEEKSAELAMRFLKSLSFPKTDQEVIHQLILSTKSHRSTGDLETDLVLDIDLSILGKEPARFREYDDAIRKEYAWVPEVIYKEKRAQVLQGFLDTSRIYLTDYFYLKYENQARNNLKSALDLLST